MESQKSIKELVEIEARYYTDENYRFFRESLPKEIMQDYVIAFFFRTLSKLMEEGRVEVNGVWSRGEWNG